ncbi:hypothetical protein QBC47DRAFT_352381 [Echria macrotheca]|uniref:ubiquitinyl hydrolase 1 n=1 Tax=Echria macrotheca TaxID=438768 RepID=A0AAJ0F776_9PEZI|nr:hypothetical protein QBC47DRAFT_352381 [Echria macrotheca]
MDPPQVSRQALDFIVDHVFLPPQLPQTDDTNTDHINAAIQVLCHSVSRFLSLETAPHASLQTVLGMLQRFYKFETLPVGAREVGLRNVFSSLSDGDVVLLYLKCQNAGVLLTTKKNEVLVEAFRLLAPNKSVMSCKGALRREFPDRAATISCDRFQDDSFLNTIAGVLDKLASSVAPMAQPKVKKAGVVESETRDTTSPVLATGMLVDIIAGLGTEVGPTRIAKRSREQVNWDETKLPFHRSPVWLLLRVAMRLVLDRQASLGQGESQYKSLMAYHHAQVLQMATRVANMPSDRLFSMKAKLARRILKLDPSNEAPWLRDVRDAINGSQAMLSERWEQAQRQDAKTLPLKKLANVSFTQDTELKLENLNRHLSALSSRSPDDHDPRGPGDLSHFDLQPHSLLPRPIGRSQNREMEIPMLLEFENWVELALPAWLHRRLNSHANEVAADICKLQSLIESYHEEASSVYKGMPEGLSTMYLVIMELWVAADILAGNLIPLLLHYDPGFAPTMFNQLLLDRKEDMERLRNLQDYLARRKANAPKPYSSAFSGFGKSSSFAVQFYQSSIAHQDLRNEIEEWASRMKEQKLQEYLEMRREYDSLKAKYNSISCEKQWISRRKRYQHIPSSCDRCCLKEEMEQLKIQVFEWPLPADSHEADAVVFEIRVPQVVSLWRSLTWKLVADILQEPNTSHEAARNKLYFAKCHSQLAKFSPSSSSLHPGSAVKFMEASHYHEKHISKATSDNICPPHAARYAYYHEPSSVCLEYKIPIPHIPRNCSYGILVAGSVLENWVRFTEHSPNAVIASQSECPLDMTLDEYSAFGHLRSSTNLQWANVSCQLKIPSLDLNKRTTLALLFQASLEAGPTENLFDGLEPVLGEAHADINEAVFVRTIIGSLSDALARVRESWQNDTALCVLARLATRLLHLCGPEVPADISKQLLGYLQKLRSVSILWARQLASKMADSKAEFERREWTPRLLNVALICSSTFNMEEKYLESTLTEPEQLVVLVEAAVLARNHLPASGRPSDSITLQLMLSWYIVMYRARDIITRIATQTGNQALDRAIKQFWVDYSPPSPGWAQVNSGTQCHILSIGESHLDVTLNLLTGNLFVNGYPLSKLPSKYRESKTFSTLFGDDVLDVGPSSIPGMHFSTCRPQHGWVVHFGWQGGQLVVRTVRDQVQGSGDGQSTGGQPGEAWEYIPNENLEADVPNSFVHDYAHWLNLITGDIEFRPLTTKWVPSIDNWHLSRSSGPAKLKRGTNFVIDPWSSTAKLTHRILGSMDNHWDINPIYDAESRCLILELPRMSLSFSIREGETAIRSRNYPGMRVDETQGFRTLIGLEDRLVLRPEQGLGLRPVLIPRGRISVCYNKAFHHTTVSIDHTNDRRVPHDAFHIDDKLGYLKDAGSMQSKLHSCLLHALTSNCLPDPLTLRTGTEEALRMLGEAAVRSFQTLDSVSRSMLIQIAKCSPVRQYYPAHLREMERVEWSGNMSPLSQPEEFFHLAKEIYNEYRGFSELFRMSGKDKDACSAAAVFDEKRTSLDLSERASIRASTLRITEYGAERHTTALDSNYRPVSQARDTGNRLATQLVRLLDTNEQTLLFKPSTSLPDIITSVNGRSFSGHPEVDLTFSIDLLGPQSTVLRGEWCGLHEALVSESNKYKKMMYLSALLYAQDSNRDVVQVLMALGNIAAFTQVLPPDEQSFDLDTNRQTLEKQLEGVARDFAKDLESCPDPNLTQSHGESVRQFEHRQKLVQESNQKDIVRLIVSELRAQLKTSWVITPPFKGDYGSYLEVDAIMSKARELVETARRSEAFQLYLASLSKTMAGLGVKEYSEQHVSPTVINWLDRSELTPRFISADSLFAGPAPDIEYSETLFSRLRPEQHHGSRNCHDRLSKLVKEMSTKDDLQDHQITYLAELRSSILSAQSGIQPGGISEDDRTLQAVIPEYLQRAREAYAEVTRQIEGATAGTTIPHKICVEAGMRPRISPYFLLQRLSRRSWPHLSKPWQCSLVAFALHLIELQRAERLFSYSLRLPESRSDILREISNAGDHRNPDWDPLEYPENLLLEIEQGIMIRPVQNEIAAKMRTPPRMQSSVMQLNMGEGKSSVILPVVASSLANGSRLVRVVVGKPQSNQMKHMLIERLGRLINRRIFYLPVSRATSFSQLDVEAVQRMLERCKKDGGVLLVQPEHILSFKLMGIDKSWVDEAEDMSSLGRTLIQSYHQDMETHARDIIDESDDNFSVRFELVYTMGSQEALDMTPGRWVLIQELLCQMESLVRDLVEAKEPWVLEGILFEDHGPGRVPTIRVLRDTEGNLLIDALAKRVCDSGLQGFPVHHQPPSKRQAVLEYISAAKPAEEVIALMEADFFADAHIKNALLLLRGLLANGVILFTLRQKRFRVNYGLTSDRIPPTMLAVPYRAKDMPSPRSEFSQPDVAIVLTCLSYYYRGLSVPELYHCIDLLAKSDQAVEEYARWAQASPRLLPSFRHFSSVNPKDRSQCEDEVFPALRYTRPTIDFYLARVVFPRETKQFPLKLSASGWDLAGSRNKTHPLTGFSGTNDSKGVLPLSVTALNVQPHTNATVLSTLLRDENTVVELAGSQGASHLSALTEAMILDVLRRPGMPEMQVVLDVGAQVVESSNTDMARKLLGASPTSHADAVIFFSDDGDELSVLTRDGVIQDFLTSPFASHTERCLVFLDQAHTRGTDLKLPDRYRAAVTLGPGLTKDTLVQACMRMRKLGRGQSVTFLVSPEMGKRIRSVRTQAEGRRLDVADVIAWAISETWDEAVRSIPLWATQGVRYLKQEAIWKDSRESSGFNMEHVQRYLEPESASLEKRYVAPAGTNDSDDVSELLAKVPHAEDGGDEQKAQFAAIRDKLAAFSSTSSPSSLLAGLEEEQERELAPEMEQERQLARPPPHVALPHSLDPDLKKFSKTGKIPAGSATFLACYMAMVKTSAAALFRGGDVSRFPTDLFITRDFSRTVKESGPAYCSDSFQRGVQWVLVGEPKNGSLGITMVVISQWEASQIKTRLEALQLRLPPGTTPPTTLHAYLPLSSLSFRTMEDLDTYVVPAAATGRQVPKDLVMQLNLFAGQLYLRCYHEYLRLCRYLGVSHTANTEGLQVGTDGFVGETGYPECEFDESPVAFLADMYKKIRRDGVDCGKTHMGAVLAGDILTMKDFPGDCSCSV